MIVMIVIHDDVMWNDLLYEFGLVDSSFAVLNPVQTYYVVFLILDTLSLKFLRRIKYDYYPE